MNNKKLTGSLSGVTSGVLWGLDTVLIAVILGREPLNNPNLLFLAPLISSALHDSFSAIWMFLMLILKKDLKSFVRALKSKDGKTVMIAAILGGPIGMTGYLMAVKYMGPSYAAAISAIYPAVGAVIARVFLKERLKMRAYIGIGVIILGITIISFTSNSNVNGNMGIGLLFAMVGVFGWAIEGVICAHGMKGDEVTSNAALQIRQLLSGSVYIFIILPVFGASKYIVPTLSSGWGVILLTALIGTLSYTFYYRAIDFIGPTKAMGLNMTYSMWAIVFDFVINGNSITYKFLICGILVIVGTLLAATSKNND